MMKVGVVTNLVGLIIVLMLSGCISSDECSECRDQTISYEYSYENVALDSAVSATYDIQSAQYAIDEDKTTSYYWSGNIYGDSLEIDLGAVHQLVEFKVYSSDSDYINRNQKKIIEISADGNTWKSTGLSNINGLEVDIFCSSLSVNLMVNEMVCKIDAEDVRFVRYTVLTDDVASIRVYEIEVIAEIEERVVTYN